MRNRYKQVKVNANNDTLQIEEGSWSINSKGQLDVDLDSKQVIENGVFVSKPIETSGISNYEVRSDGVLYYFYNGLSLDYQQYVSIECPE